MSEIEALRQTVAQLEARLAKVESMLSRYGAAAPGPARGEDPVIEKLDRMEGRLEDVERQLRSAEGP